MDHTPLHLISENQSVATAGRLRKAEHRWRVFNAFAELELSLDPDHPELTDRALVRLGGHRRQQTFFASDVQMVHRPDIAAPPLAQPRNPSLGDALRARHRLYRQIRRFFESRNFLEVQTPAAVFAPGTDPHLEPVPVELRDDDRANAPRMPGHLHTSPELAMKRLLAAGAGPIYQLTRVWRHGEITPIHNPEFTLLEWYRPWNPMEAIIDDVERLVRRLLHDQSARPVTAEIPRMTMQEVVDQACGFDLLEALDADSLRREIKRRDLLSDRAMEQARWDELFFSLTISHLDPFLKTLGAVFVTEWPRPLAILARRCDGAPRVAERFELYVDGIELANGFGELTDPDEQRRRFEKDNTVRRDIGRRPLPIPEAFLRSLRWGLPPSAGVAVGVDRLLMLAVDGASTLRDVAPFALVRDGDGIDAL